MSRNMIESNKKVFHRLIQTAQRSERVLENADKPRWIQTNADEKNWLQDLELGDVRTLSPRVRTAQLSYAGRNFLAVVGFTESTEPDYVLEPFEMNAGLLTALLAELDVPIREGTDPLEIVNEILPQHQGAPGYAGHFFTSVAAFFEPVLVYEVRANSPIKAEDLARLSCFWILQNGERLVLPFSPRTWGEIEDLTATGAETVPFDVVLNCILSAQWPHAFLEVYRCVERLFCVQIIEDLHRELALSIPLVRLAEKIETAIGWRPREEDAIERLFTLLPSDALTLMEGVRDSVSPNPAEKIHRWIYDLRNSVVHFRPATPRFSLSDAQWDEVLRATVLLIAKIYGIYDTHLQSALVPGPSGGTSGPFTQR